MPRNLDLTALRSFVAVADSGGVTKASSALNLTQSAVSMQLKRLEESLGQSLLDRSGRTIALTPAGEQLLGYGRRMLALNDDIFSKMTDDGFEGTLILGAPHDVIYPAIPRVLQLFRAEYPRMRVQLLSSWTYRLLELFEQGKCDVIVTTEDDVRPGGETLIEKPLLWYGARNGTAWQQRPLPIASEPHCQFRKGMLAALDAAEIPWEMAVHAESMRTIEATVAADLAVYSQLEDTVPPLMEVIPHNGSLPELAAKKLNLYVSDVQKSPTLPDLADLVRRSYRNTALALTA